MGTVLQLPLRGRRHPLCVVLSLRASLSRRTLVFCGCCLQNEFFHSFLRTADTHTACGGAISEAGGACMHAVMQVARACARRCPPRCSQWWRR